MDSWEKGRGPGGIEGLGDETREFLIVAGGDGDNTGVYPPQPKEKAEPDPDPEQLPKGAQFPARFDGHCTD